MVAIELGPEPQQFENFFRRQSVERHLPKIVKESLVVVLERIKHMHRAPDDHHKRIAHQQPPKGALHLVIETLPQQLIQVLDEKNQTFAVLARDFAQAGQGELQALFFVCFRLHLLQPDCRPLDSLFGQRLKCCGHQVSQRADVELFFREYDRHPSRPQLGVLTDAQGNHLNEGGLARSAWSGDQEAGECAAINLLAQGLQQVFPRVPPSRECRLQLLRRHFRRRVLVCEKAHGFWACGVFPFALAAGYHRRHQSCMTLRRKWNSLVSVSKCKYQSHSRSAISSSNP